MLTGRNLINGQWMGSDEVVNSADLVGVAFAQASADQVNMACNAARAAFRPYASTPDGKRAMFLRAIADEIDASAQVIAKVGPLETGLPAARFDGERARTTGQLKLFSEMIERGEHLDSRKDEALPDRQPLPRTELRLIHRPIGPVVVFGASNFPLAFSTAGGDTASALGAGCPVIVKGHSAHSGVAELVGQAIQRAAERTAMPRGTFQMLQGAGRVVGQALVQHPEIRAVGFTGSQAGGRALYNLCHSRPAPIPFYGELGSINPVFLLPTALHNRAPMMGEGWAMSLVLGAGQFCTNPGVVIAIKGERFTAFEEAAVAALKKVAAQKMLSDGIHAAYVAGVKNFSALMKEVGSCGVSDQPRHALPAAFRIDAKTWMATPALQHEVFGAAGILVECDDLDQMMALAEGLEGQLTATMQYDDEDLPLASTLMRVLEEKAGRLLCNGFPTGVEVCSAMMHGGPYPASTDVRSTSVGSLAIRRWLRPVCYQNFPDALLT